jgi:hypothetical protein
MSNLLLFAVRFSYATPLRWRCARRGRCRSGRNEVLPAGVRAG